MEIYLFISEKKTISFNANILVIIFNFCGPFLNQNSNGLTPF